LGLLAGIGALVSALLVPLQYAAETKVDADEEVCQAETALSWGIGHLEG
jgi:hypothetical protein